VVTPDTWPRATSGLYPYGLAITSRGGLAVGGDGSITMRPSTRALALAFDAAGALVADFAQGGRWVDNTLHGCYDVAADGDGWVLACLSVDDRPALIRLDARGQRDPSWGERGGPPASLHPGFQVRALHRDGLGRWLVGGVVSAVYDDQTGPTAVVRYLPDGTLDRTFAVQGVAFAHNGRVSFVYSGRGLLATGCEDRVLIGGSTLQHPVVEVFEATGRWMSEVSPRGYLMAPAHPSLAPVAYPALLTTPTAHEVLLVTPSAHRITLARFSM